MIAAVPRNVDEADQQSVLVPGTNPAQAVRADPVPPTERRAPAVRLCERQQLLVVYVASKLVLQTHVSMVADEESLGHQPSDMQRRPGRSPLMTSPLTERSDPDRRS